MALDDLKERLVSESKAQWEKLQESSAFIQLREKYENLTPSMQKATLIGASLTALLLAFSVPFSYYSNSGISISEFEDKRQLIRDMMKVSRESQEVPSLPVPPDVNTLKSQIDSQLQAARLVPEQILSTEISSDKLNLIPGSMLQGVVKVTLSQLNLRQILDLGHQFQAISPSVKMANMRMEANAKDPRYFDVIYQVAVLSVPNQAEPPSETAEPPPKKKRGK